MIARFWGAFTPGGFTGLGGWRIYDITKQTGKAARATATIGIEMILGQLAFGAVVMAASIYGISFLGFKGVLLINAFFVCLMAAGLTLLAKPQLFRFFAKLLPAALRARIATLVDAVCAYHGKFKLLMNAFLWGIGTHAFNNLVYVSAAHALGVELSVGVVFFASSLQIFATLLPASINGIGLREAAAVALYTRMGIAASQAVLIPIVGFAAEMLVSSVGGILFAMRKPSFKASIQVDDQDREEALLPPEAVDEQLPPPEPFKELWLGLSAGFWAGITVGLLEALVVTLSGAAFSPRLFAYGALVYGVFGSAMGAGVGVCMAYVDRFQKRAAVALEKRHAFFYASVVSFLVFALGAFRVRRDVFEEQLVWKSPKGLLAAMLCALAAVVLFYLLRFVWAALQRVLGKAVQSLWAVPAMVFIFALLIAALEPSMQRYVSHKENQQTVEDASQKNVLFIVVDTLRADRLPLYGYGKVKTPHLDALAKDAVLFKHAFVNASWTRPSFASILSGRLPSSHGVMAKSDALPDALTTLPEGFQSAGWSTAGFVTNYNVAPYFNFHQGFDNYQYLEPDFVLGADDAAAKLLLVQFLKQKIERFRAMRGTVETGTAYQDAGVVNKHALQWLKQKPAAPWFLFLAYMDPHDPYFEHPYNGKGYARAAHPKPQSDEADALSQLYNGEIEYWDAQFGKLIAELKQQGLYDKLTIVLTADHGEEFAEHGGFWHGTTLYDEQLHVPLLVKLPNNEKAGQSIEHWVQSIDLMPTLLSQFDIALPKGVQGGNLFEGTDLIYAEESHEGNVLQALRERKDFQELKLIEANKNNPRGLPEFEFFRLEEDPNEQRNLAEQEPELVAEFKTAIKENSEKAKHAAVRKQPVDVEHNAQAAQRLRALGYVAE
ncbi:MAG: sulfatase-like hydrolase/transferase [Myxococcales bacterium]|nr:MAG: sulfatase-like hydrolase/transferase [Myxococcales bacterium]